MAIEHIRVASMAENGFLTNLNLNSHMRLVAALLVQLLCTHGNVPACSLI